MNYSHPQLREHLASEYVLGTLHGQARRRFEALLGQDPGLRAVVAQWEARLHPHSESLTPHTPPAHVWDTIQHRVQAQRSDTRQPPARARRSLPRVRRTPTVWRSLGLVVAGIVLGISVMLMLPAQHTGAPERMVLVTNKQAKPLWLISTRLDARKLTVKTLHSPGTGPRKACVLWLKWPNGHVESLGELPEHYGQVNITLPRNMPYQADKAEITVSVETAGKIHSQPHGRIIFNGHWSSI